MESTFTAPIPSKGTAFGVIRNQVFRVTRTNTDDWVCATAFVQPNGALGSWMEPADNEVFVGGSLFGNLSDALKHAQAHLAD